MCIIPAFRRQELENQEIKASLGYTRPHVKERGGKRERRERMKMNRIKNE